MQQLITIEEQEREIKQKNEDRTKQYQLYKVENFDLTDLVIKIERFSGCFCGKYG